MKFRYKLLVAALGTLGIFIWGRLSARPKPAIVLPSNVVEHIQVDPHHHTLTIITPHGTDTIFLPDHPSTIDLGTNGQLTVKARQMGVEVRPFAGVGYSNTKAVVAGLDLAYFKRVDVGLGWVVPLDTGWAQTSRFSLCASYNVWSNVRVTGSVNNDKTVGLFLTVRL